MFSAPYRTGSELPYLEEVLASTVWHGDGAFTRRATSWLATRTGAPTPLLTTSGTHALDMAALLLDLAPGDEVILPAFTFSSTAASVALRGATPVFVDITPETLNLDPRQAALAITPRTRAIFVLHYGGVAADIDEILRLTEEHGLAVVEDNAHGLGAYWDDRHLGTFGRFGVQSWHDTKNITAGEGGALLVNDPSDVERAEIIREKGTDRSRFLRGAVDKYTWVDHGSSYLPSELSAAVLLAQFEHFEGIQRRRHMVWDHYASSLSEWAYDIGARLMSVPDRRTHPAHLFYVLTPRASDQSGLIEHLAAHDIVAAFHYQPLHRSRAGVAFGRSQGDCPVSTDIASRLVRLPLHAGLSPEDAERVSRAVRCYRPRER